MKKTISVIFSNYNHAQYVSEAIDAILSQSYKPLEIIIIDDASTDNSVEEIERFVRQNSTIRLIKNTQNMGAIYNIQKLIQLSEGDYIYFAAADDRVLPGFFEKSMKLLNEYPKAGFCCSNPVFFEDNSGITTEERFGIANEALYMAPDKVAEMIRKTPFWIAGHTSIVRRDAFLKAGGYIEQLRWHCDWFAMIVIAFRYGICYVPEPLATMRVAQSTYSAAGRKNKQVQQEVLLNMLNILKSSAYKDVLPLFKQSRVLSTYGLQLLEILLRHPEHRDFYNSKLLKTSLMQLISPVTPSFIKDIYRRLQGRRNIDFP